MKEMVLMFSWDTLKRWFYFHFLCKVSNRGTGNTIISDMATLKKVNITISGNNNVIKIGKGTLLRGTKVVMKGNNNKLIIGENCTFRKGLLQFCDHDGTIEIGNGTTAGGGTEILVSQPDSVIKIGDDCMISYDVLIQNSDGHSIIDLTTRKRINFDQSIFIGNHVWLGAYSRILKGVDINDNCIIGLGSIVTAQVPANSIAAGIPARIIKRDITWTREKYLRDEPIPEELIYNRM